MDKARVITGVIFIVLGIALFIAGFFTNFITWIYAIPLIIFGILLIIDIGKENHIESIKKYKEKRS